ncbi:hypothetical protein GLYMA_18G102000v4 [Glycine max]|uniref:Uncharacterized protein n=1 Tax=Glycine max TaxID=3847 RepID=A0A0R0F9G6_SOYBN|nr:cyclin-D4-1 isoform X1 [Glycine max]KAH1197498.1 Cyclin-D4-2 [Glycine max]KRG98842.1 hypothetical protein GLYMA_18G102000v4 [Glycine max]|eukprot:XP_006602226.1 cyclin-D4-1 isoform X1 [Glycine max]
MAPSFDFASSLLCTEDNTVFDESHNNGGTMMSMMGMCEDAWSPRKRHFDEEPDELPLLSDESLAMMVEKECQHWPGLRCLNKLQTGDLDFGARMEVVDRILKKGRVWTMQLMAVACLSLVWKMFFIFLSMFAGRMGSNHKIKKNTWVLLCYTVIIF